MEWGKRRELRSPPGQAWPSPTCGQLCPSPLEGLGDLGEGVAVLGLVTGTGFFPRTTIDLFEPLDYFMIVLCACMLLGSVCYYVSIEYRLIFFSYCSSIK